MLAKEDCPSIGIVAFSEAQQAEIEDALSRLAETDKAFADRLEMEYEREADGQFAGLLIKNLENIQGDERDVIILSVCYGRAPDGKVRMNFGPINQSGGERRLNVAFSRAKHHMVVVSSIRHTDITNDYNEGANCLKSYLEYAAACSCGDISASHRVLHGLAVWKDLEPQSEMPHGAVARQIAAAMIQRGYSVDLGVGMSHFRCDIAARRHGEQEYRLGILVDTDSHYRHDDLLEREMLRPQLLRDFGWTITHVLARDWYVDRGAVLDRLVQMIENRQDSPLPESDVAEDEGVWAELDGPEDSEAGVDAEADIDSPKEVVNPDIGGHDTTVTPLSTPKPPTAALAGPFKRYFEFVGGSSRKFWEIALSGNTVTVRFGRIGTTGQTQQKVFAADALAAGAARRLIAEKLGKGYQEQNTAVQ